ncbi:MAG: DNA methyltransferase [Candidatus Bathyarchaeia archaeon]|jgi:site-specific DNA-methyltransferase (adenine-specific)
MPIAYKEVKDTKYLYFFYYDNDKKKKTETYCGLASDPTAIEKAEKLESEQLQKQIIILQRQLKELNNRSAKRLNEQQTILINQKIQTPNTTPFSIPKTNHTIYIADSREMTEIEDNSIHLVVCSPPYFNAPHDYKNLFKNYEDFLSLMKDLASQMARKLQDGRIACINCDDMLVDGEKWPIVADIIGIFRENGFRYRDQIIWRKPDGYIRASRRSGVLIQHPYPMYFYPDNVSESILIFQKNRNFDYQSVKPELNEMSKIDVNEYLDEKWYMNMWTMTNVLPLNRIEKGIAAFPDELPYRLIKLFSFVGETVLDPVLGSGTTSKVAKELGRNSIGYEKDGSLIPIIQKKIASRLKLKNPKLLEQEPTTEISYDLQIKTRKPTVLVSQ